MTTRSASPLARATMMYSCPRISSTDARVIRAMMAPGAAAVVTAGSTRWESRSARPPAPRVEYIPRLGSQRRSMAKTTMRTRPSQKGGMLPTTSEALMVTRSIAVLSRAAARTPAAMPAVAARTKLAPAKINVLPNFGSSSSTTGWCTEGERARAPGRARPRHLVDRPSEDGVGVGPYRQRTPAAEPVDRLLLEGRADVVVERQVGQHASRAGLESPVPRDRQQRAPHGEPAPITAFPANRQRHALPPMPDDGQVEVVAQCPTVG